MMRRLLAIAFLLAGPSSAMALDPHAIYERACARCHQAHAGPFAEETLARRDDRVVSARDGRDLETFLEAGHGRLSPEDVSALLDLFNAILSANRLYDGKCRVCHDRGVVLARHELILRDGVLVGRYSGRPVETFLRHHGRLTDDELPVILAMLERQLRTADD